MLPLGKLRVTDKEGGGTTTRFTPDEQQTMMTLWCIFRSPLIFGGDLPSNDAATTALITNEEVLEVNQHSSSGHEVLEGSNNIRVWVADGAKSGEKYLAVFNLGDTAENGELPWSTLGLSAGTAEVRDLWLRKSLGAQDGIHVRVAAHGSVLYKVALTR
jgi:alpha-galactosidase